MCIQLFQDSQHQTIVTTIVQQKLRPKMCVNIPLFAAVLQQTHGFALEKILKEYTKLPITSPPTPGCQCTIQQSFGLPCYHTIQERKSNRGVLLLSDIHRHQYYDRPDFNAEYSTSVQPISRPVLNPIPIRGKGRPRGALRGVLQVLESSTKRYPSAFELLPSTAPAAFERPRSPTEQLFVVPSGLNQPSSTSPTMARIAAGHSDQYEPGTQRERGHMRGLSTVYRDDPIEENATYGQDQYASAQLSLASVQLDP